MVDGATNDDLATVLTNDTAALKHRQLTGSLAELVVDLILNLCNQQPRVLKSLATSPAFVLLLHTVLGSDSVDKNISFSSMFVLNSF